MTWFASARDSAGAQRWFELALILCRQVPDGKSRSEMVQSETILSSITLGPKLTRSLDKPSVQGAPVKIPNNMSVSDLGMGMLCNAGFGFLNELLYVCASKCYWKCLKPMVK